MLLTLIRRFSRPYTPLILAVVGFQLASTIAALYLPSLNAQIIDEGVARGDTDFIWRTGAVMLLVAFVQVGTAIAGVYFGSKTAMALGRDLRRAVFRKVTSFSAKDVNAFGAPTLITRGTNDVQQVQMLVLMALNFMVATPIMCAFVREPYETGRFGVANKDLTDVSLRIGSLFVLMFPVIGMILHLSTAAVLWFGGQRVDSGDMQVGALTAFLQYLLQILMAVMMGTFMAMMIPRASVCADRIGEVLDVEPSIHDPEHPDAPAALAGVVEYRNVTFAYPGAESPVLSNISFTAKPGETIAIIGSTGAGKSTLLSLLPRLYDTVEGEVLLDGVPVSRLDRAEITRRVALVPQRPYLFSGTVAHNLRFGKTEATDQELWDALRVAQGEDFVRDMKNGLEARIAQGGTNVSGGQRQRLCIARALVTRPRVYLFDDSFSALDVATDTRLRAALKRTTADATVIIVAQRISTITEADQILVLDNGRIVDRGTHEELLETSPTYQEIVESQLSVEEMA